MKKSTLLLFSVLLFIFSCDSDFDVNADWKESMVVYGLLDQSVDTQKVIIYKAFLGNQSAYALAQEIDSIYYGENDLEVFLYGLDGEDTIQTIALNYTETNNRNHSGSDTIFSLEKSVEYTTTEKLDPELVYHFYALNLNSGNEVRSSTSLISPLDINEGFGDVIFFKNNQYRTYKLKWKSSANAISYKPILRFYYIEKDIFTGEVSYKFIEKEYAEQSSVNANGGQQMELGISGESFYYFVKNSISPNENVERINAQELDDGVSSSDNWLGGIEFRFVVGGEEISQYISINNLPNLLFQDPPTYTNIENGLGIFSSRLNASLSYKKLEVQSLSELSSGETTNELGFIVP